jgi:hypothetical protein
MRGATAQKKRITSSASVSGFAYGNIAAYQRVASLAA